MAANQIECFKDEQRSIIKYLLAENNKLYEIYRKMCDVHSEANGLNIDLPLKIKSKRQSMEWKQTDSLVK